MFTIFKKKCAVGNQKANEPRKYYDDQHKIVLFVLNVSSMQREELF